MSKVKNRLHRARSILKERLKEIKEEESIWTAKELQI
jgi:RNA polymerase sigma-70 factor (ECF subfamily)